jgi:hypothetical protein
VLKSIENAYAADNIKFIAKTRQLIPEFTVLFNCQCLARLDMPNGVWIWENAPKPIFEKFEFPVSKPPKAC